MTVADPFPVPAMMTNRREWIIAMKPRLLRDRAGIHLATIATALEIPISTVSKWENGRAPLGARGAAYCRVIAGLARHLEVPEEKENW